MNRLAVINVVGLTESLIGPQTPRIAGFCNGGAKATILPAFPAVTCTAQSNYLTGKRPSEHGIVGNGWFNRELAEVHFWKQSNHLVQSSKIWETLKSLPAASPRTVANCFWWFNMYSGADYSITPRPIYRADGGKVFDIHSWPYSIRREIKNDLGDFPFLGFWGPAAGIKTPQGPADCATRWIAESAKWIENRFSPALNLVYLPHLDYNLQRHGPFAQTPNSGRDLNPAILPDLAAIDEIVGGLIDFFSERRVQVVLLSEYGLTNVDTPIYLNRIFRKQGWLAVKDELGLEILDAGASRAFAVADHQIAHIYLNDPSLEEPVRQVLEGVSGIEKILGSPERKESGLAHARAGDLVAVAAENAWFAYYYWEEDARAPDFARTVDIHRKPGYDPAELFIDPKIRLPKFMIARRLLQKKLEFRMLMDVIPLDATLVKGSHGRRPADKRDWPIIMVQNAGHLKAREIDSTDVYQILLRHLSEA